MVKVLQFLMIQMEHLQTVCVRNTGSGAGGGGGYLETSPNIPGGGGNGGSGVVLIAYPT